MADDCVCSALTSIYTMQSDLFTQIVSKLNSINSTLSTNNTRLQSINNNLSNLFGHVQATLENIQSAISNGLMYDNGVSCLYMIHSDLYGLKDKFEYNNKNIAEIWSYKEMCVSNETIVESPLSTYVSKGSLEFNDV